MSASQRPSRDRLEELLVEDLDRSLTDAERAELLRLLEEHPEVGADDAALAAAAAQEVFGSGGGEPLSPSLRARLVSAGEAEVSRVAEARSARPPVRLQAIEGGRHREPEPEPQAAARGDRGRTTWMVVAVAASLLAVFGWWPRLMSKEPGQSASETPARAPSPVEARAALLREANDIRAIRWAAAGDPLVKEVSGEVVWSDLRQTGFMRFVGLPANDPTRHRYQLWIFDAERDERYPVDGGVFDVGGQAGEVVVPIQAKLPVKKPTLFAVTLEGPDGAVVSTREHILTIAKVL